MRVCVCLSHSLALSRALSLSLSASLFKPSKTQAHPKAANDQKANCPEESRKSKDVQEDERGTACETLLFIFQLLLAAQHLKVVDKNHTHGC